MVELSIIIPTFNRNKIANQCVRSVLDCGLNLIEVIVVNDSKGNKFQLSSNNKSSIIKVVDNPKQGVASARNFGASIAKSDKLVFIDDDMIVNKQAILNAIVFLKTQPNATYNANWVYDKKIMQQISQTSFGRFLIKYNFTSLKGWNGNDVEWKEHTFLKADGITSQFFAIKKNDFEIIGGYNEKFPFAGFEDYEFYKKMQENQIVNYIDTNVTIYHNELDRLNVKNWLNRQKRGAQTRRVAVNMGYKELKIEYSFIKELILQLLSVCNPIIVLFLNMIPNSKLFDAIYAKIISGLIAVNIYEGYKIKTNIK